MNSGPPTSKAFRPAGPGGLAGRIVLFAIFLKRNGFRIFQSGVLEALRSLERIDIGKRQDFFTALRANLVTSDLEWARFEDLFDAFFHESPEEPRGESDRASSGQTLDGDVHPEPVPDAPAQAAASTSGTDQKECLEGILYSPVSKLEKKDFSRLRKEEVQVAELALKQIMTPFRLQRSRRSKRARKHGELDFPRVMRRSLKAEGVPLELFYKEKRRRLKRLVLLADVSGSMDRYARFALPFILGIRGIGSRAEVFVFSTSLTRVTAMLRHVSLEKALGEISREVPDWSGGTRIGYSLHQFNQEHGMFLLNRRTVVLVLSDGWDLGGKDLLKREMEALSRKAHTVIWLNPLAGDPDYRPVCQGMMVALPYVDHLLAADSLQSLKRVGRLLSRVMTR